MALKKAVEPTNVGLFHHDIELFLLQLWTSFKPDTVEVVTGGKESIVS